MKNKFKSPAITSATAARKNAQPTDMKTPATLTVSAPILYNLIHCDLTYGDFLNQSIEFSNQHQDETGYGYGATHDGHHCFSLKLTLALIDIFNASVSSILARLPIMEALLGEHTQRTLDESLELCRELASNHDGFVDLRTLHQFLEVEEQYSPWSFRLLGNASSLPYDYDKIKIVPGSSKGMIIFGHSAFLWNLVVSHTLAFEISLSEPGRRGRRLRKHFIHIHQLEM